MALSLDLDVGDTIMIGDSSISLIKKTGRKARLSIDAAKDIDVSLIQDHSANPRDAKMTTDAKA